jgi:hypothetical protein
MGLEDLGLRVSDGLPDFLPKLSRFGIRASNQSYHLADDLSFRRGLRQTVNSSDLGLIQLPSCRRPGVLLDLAPAPFTPKRSQSGIAPQLFDRPALDGSDRAFGDFQNQRHFLLGESGIWLATSARYTDQGFQRQTGSIAAPPSLLFPFLGQRHCGLAIRRAGASPELPTGIPKTRDPYLAAARPMNAGFKQAPGPLTSAVGEQNLDECFNIHAF